MKQLLELLTLKNTVATIDAMGCQRAIAEQIHEAGGDDVLAVKDNQKTLHEDLKLLFTDGIERGFEGMSRDVRGTVEKGHGRIETRKVWVTREVDWLRERGDRAGLRSAVRVETRRRRKRASCKEAPAVGRLRRPGAGSGGREAEGERGAASLHQQPGSSGSGSGCGVDRLGDAEPPGHRDEGASQGNGLLSRRRPPSVACGNRVLDVVFREDDLRLREANSAENFSRMQRLVMNLLCQDDTIHFKESLERRRKLAGWSDGYPLQLLGLEGQTRSP